MGALTNQYVSQSYQGLLKLENSTGITSTLQYVEDGAGANLPLQLSETQVKITGSLFVADLTSNTGLTQALVVDTNTGQIYRNTITGGGGSGSSGTSGTSGQNGSSGTSGTSGSSGSSGTSGSSGSSGTSGVGTSGTSGTSGDSIFAQTGSVWNTTRNVGITGSLIVTNGITGSLFGSASYAINAETSSLARDVIVVARCNNPGGLTKGTVVRIVGATGDNPLIDSASFINENESANVLGMLSENVAFNADANVVVNGKVLALNTVNFPASSLLFLSSSGQFTTASATPPSQSVRLGQVLRQNVNQGSIYFRAENGYELEELHNVLISSPQQGDLLSYVSGSYGLWENKTTSQLGLATTGSNNFVGNQNITGNTIVTGSVAFRTGDKFFDFSGAGFSLGGPTENTPISVTGSIQMGSGSVHFGRGFVQFDQTFSGSIYQLGTTVSNEWSVADQPSNMKLILATTESFKVPVSESIFYGDLKLPNIQTGTTSNFVIWDNATNALQYTTASASGTSGTSGTSGQAGSSGTSGTSGTSGDSIFALTGSVWNTTRNVGITGSLRLSGSATYDLEVTGSARFVSPDGTQLNTLTPNTFNIDTTRRSGVNAENYVFGHTSSIASVYVGVYDQPDFGQDVELKISVDTGSGIRFYDFDNATAFDYVNWMSIAPNLGNNPAPQFKRSVAITGSLRVSGSAIVTGSVQGNVNALSISSNTASLNLNNGNFFTLQLVSGSNTFINPSNIKAGQTVNIEVSTTGSATVSFPSSVKQVSGSAYVPTTTTGKDIITLVSFDSSNLYLANVKNLA